MGQVLDGLCRNADVSPGAPENGTDLDPSAFPIPISSSPDLKLATRVVEAIANTLARQHRTRGD